MALVLMVLPWLLSPLSAQEGSTPPADIHVVIAMERAYMGAVTKWQVEYWLGPGRTWMSQRGRVAIVRRDLGVRWRLDPAKSTYVEEPLAEAVPAPAAAPPDGIHTARFEYEPDFEWRVEATGPAAVAGRDARAFAAHGEADFAETALGFALADRVVLETQPDVNQLLIDQVRTPSVQRFLSDVVRREKACLVSYEETYEPAVAPTIVTRGRITVLQVAAAPTGTYDVPAGFTNASPRAK